MDLKPYVWRGKTYKTLRGLHTAMLKIYPGALAFDQCAAYLRDRSTIPTTTRRFTRTITNTANVIADNPD